MTFEKGLRSEHGKAVQLHDSLGSPRTVNELPTISASIYHVIAMSCNLKRSGKFFAKKFSINAYCFKQKNLSFPTIEATQ